MEEKNFVFEEAMKRIEEIVIALEKGDVALDQSLSLFQEGAELIKKCSGALDNAEQKVSLLIRTEQGPDYAQFDGENA
jgi:exodeoxyribonuclease VII small subunit